MQNQHHVQNKSKENENENENEEKRVAVKGDTGNASMLSQPSKNALEKYRLSSGPQNL
jgi:hypothetical protein